MSRSPALSLLFLLSLPGCFRTVVETPAARSGAHDDGTSVSWLALTSATTDARECTYGVAKAETYLPFWGTMVYVLTAGIVAPMTAEYHCAAGPKAEQAPAVSPQQ